MDRGLYDCGIPTRFCEPWLALCVISVNRGEAGIQSCPRSSDILEASVDPFCSVSVGCQTCWQVPEVYKKE